jgi:hypothetical protein
MAYAEPWTQVVLAALCLHTYAEIPVHDHGWIARQLGVDADTVARCIATLAATGQIRWDGTHWETTPIFEQDTASDPESTRVMKAHFARVGLERMPGGANDLFSVNFLTASADDVARLRELHVAYFRAVREIVRDSRGPFDRIVVVNTQLFALGRSQRKPAPRGRPAVLGIRDGTTGGLIGVARWVVSAHARPMTARRDGGHCP